MSKIVNSSTEWNGKILSVEVGRIARAASSVQVNYGKTSVLVAVTAEKEVEGDCGSGLPLTVNFSSKTYATCKIPGGFFKREGKPSEREILASRIVDRSIRPILNQDLLNAVSVNCILLSYEGGCVPEVLSLIGVSIAFARMKLPFDGPVVGVTFSSESGVHSFNAGCNEAADLEMFISSTADDVVMIEAEAKEVAEETVLSAINASHQNVQPVINFINDVIEECDKAYSDSCEMNYCHDWEFSDYKDLLTLVSDFCKSHLEELYSQHYTRNKREKELRKIRNDAIAKFASVHEKSLIKHCIKILESDVVRKRILNENLRIDGRTNSEIRDISVNVSFSDIAHGSALFTRGGTQALVVLTLGSFQDEQVIDDFDGDRRENFMLHYNFFSYSVGEVGASRGPGRREIGHGRLALKAIKAVLPSREIFPYTTRIVSDILESDGSSSMATVCGASLALMDAGVPIRKPVAGIAMGLVKEGDKFVVLSDILGDEDSLGDMDFKVAGTKEGITAIQLDIKMKGMDQSFIAKILDQALEGRLHILEKMNAVIAVPNPDLKENVLKIISFRVPKDSVQKIIGSAGKNIKAVSENYAVKIDIDPSANVYISGETTETVLAAKAAVESFVESSFTGGSSSHSSFSPEEGKVYQGKVVSIMYYGAFVEIAPSVQGLVHISEITNARLDDIHDVLSENDKVWVVLKCVDSTGRLKLSMKYVDQETGELSPEYSQADMGGTAPRRDSSPKRSSFGGGGSRSPSGGGSKPFGSSRPMGGPRSSSSGGPKRDGSSRDGGRPSRDPKKRSF